MILDHPAWVALQQGVTNAITANMAEWVIGIGALGVAAVCVMPEKCPLITGEVDSSIKEFIQQWWSWIRNTLQTAVPAARASHVQQTINTPNSQIKTTVESNTGVSPSAEDRK